MLGWDNISTLPGWAAPPKSSAPRRARQRLAVRALQQADHGAGVGIVRRPVLLGIDQIRDGGVAAGALPAGVGGEAGVAALIGHIGDRGVDGDAGSQERLRPDAVPSSPRR